MMLRLSRVLSTVALGSFLVACGSHVSFDDGGDPPDGAVTPDAPGTPDAIDLCAGNTAPAAPTVLSPTAGLIDVIGDQLAIQVSDYVDADGDPVVAAELEIWQLDGAGLPDTRVWSASVAAPTPGFVVALTDGAFVAGRTALDEWEDYAIFARYTDDHAGCIGRGDDSPARTFRTDDGSIALFDDTIIREVRITLPPATITSLNAQAYPPGCVPFERTYYEGAVEIDGVAYDHVGVKTKGGCGSSRNLDSKPSFKLALSWDDPAVEGCPDERRLGGQKTLTLNNDVQDNSMSHERLGYGLYRALGAPVPRIATVKVFVNDVYYGLYQNIESITRRFLAHNFTSSGGMLYEGTYWCDLYDGNAHDDDTGCLTREFKQTACDSEPDLGDDPLTYEPLRDFIAKLDAVGGNSFYPEVLDYMDFEAFLSTWAVEAFMGHWDGYNFNIVNNYRFYHDPVEDKWSLIATGIDQTFGSNLNPWTVTGRIAQMCLADQECEDAYAARLDAVIATAAEVDLNAQSLAIQAQLGAEITVAQGRGVDINTFNNYNVATRNFIAGRPAQLTSYMASQGY